MKLLNNIKIKKYYDGCPAGVDQLVIAGLAQQHSSLLIVLRDDNRLAQFTKGMQFVAPDLPIISVPAWDCLPYDRVSPHSSVTSQRLAALSQLSAGIAKPHLVVTTVNGWLQKCAPPEFFSKASLALRPGQQIEIETLTHFLTAKGFHRTDTVREYGEFAVRGGIVDVFADAGSEPLRIDFFGDEIETIKRFDSLSQRSTGKQDELLLQPASEFLLDEEAIALFRGRFLESFGGRAAQSALYESVSAGRVMPAIEHWSAFLHEKMAVIEDYCPDAAVIFDEESQAAIFARLEQIEEFYQARMKPDMDEDVPYYPLPPHYNYRQKEMVEDVLASDKAHFLSSFSQDRAAAEQFDAKGRIGASFTPQEGQTQLQVAIDYLKEKQKTGPVIIAATSEGAARRTGDLLKELSSDSLAYHDNLADALSQGIAVTYWPLDKGFVFDNLTIVTEQDIFGTRLARPVGRRRADNFLTEVSALEQGDLVVHVEHGIGRYEKLETVSAAGIEHDCLMLIYQGGDKLYLPVENIDMLDRFGIFGACHA